jgi:tRNA threonylcarbamoyladenosine biosynthesis protein TsaB
VPAASGIISRGGRRAALRYNVAARMPRAGPSALNILAFDTSTEYCSAALWRDGEVEAREAHAGQRHSELLLDMIDELLGGRAPRAAGLDGVAFGRGPGSFTGLRIACGVAQGIAFGAALPVIGIDTLLAMACGAGAPRVVCCLDARMREVYHAAYERDGELWRTVCEPSVCPPAQAPALPGGGWLGCGSGFAAYAQALAQRYQGALAGVEPGRYPHAREIARLAAPRFARGEGVSAERAAPFYVRDKVALTTAER